MLNQILLLVVMATALAAPQIAAKPITVNVPILMYHHVGNPNTWQTYSVSTANFDWQMNYLVEHGYHAVSLDQVAAALTDGAALPANPIALTFDDGWANQYANALPILKKYGLKATFYLVTNCLGKPECMTWEQAAELRDAGMWIGSHSVSHPNLRGLSAVKLRDQLTQSKAALQDRLGVRVSAFAYPGGSHDARVVRATQAAGYTTATTVIKGYAQRADKLFQLQRVGVYGIDTAERFIAKVDGTFFVKHWPAVHDPAPEIQ